MKSTPIKRSPATPGVVIGGGQTLTVNLAGAPAKPTDRELKSTT